MRFMSRIVIVGAGAAGLMSAIFAARAGADVTLIDHNEKAGKKIYITGKGRCNCTNDCDMDAFLAEVPRNPRFLYSALRFFSPRDLMALLEEAGCPVTVQRGRRVFPSSEKASDVTKALLKLCGSLGVRLLLNTEAEEIILKKVSREDTVAEKSLARDGVEPEKPRAAGVRLAGGGIIEADAVILATGGLSVPATGSTGDGYRFARALGHTVLPPRPSLSALETRESWPASLQGLSLRNTGLTLMSGKKTLYSRQGELLFTHFGVSGPLVLEASCHLPEEPRGALLVLDLKPGLTHEQLDARLLREFADGGKKQLKNVLPSLLPQRLAELFPTLCGLPREIPCPQVTAIQRRALTEALKGLTLTVERCRPLDEAIITRGGVSVREINPSTMESRLVPGLYFAGELIDVDAHTGGYNLQIAFSTGALAGASAADTSAAGE